MAVHKLILENDFDEDIYSLIAIHCTIEDYRLAYLLNKCLGITLTRKVRGVGFQEETFLYSMFEWLDNKQMINWNLVSNIYKTEKNTKNKSISLFNSLDKITTVSYLIPQYKTVNYFLKIGVQARVMLFMSVLLSPTSKKRVNDPLYKGVLIL